MAMRIDLSPLYPLGWPWKKEVQYSMLGLGLATLYGLFVFLFSFHSVVSELYVILYGKEVLIPGSTVPPFPPVFRGALLGYCIVAFCMIFLPIAHHRWHSVGSRSIYLMRRLPRRQEFCRRCVAGPALGLALTLLTALLLLFLCFLWYWFRTPAGHLPLDVWAGIGGILC